jgi:hypothetical protein
MGDMGEVFRDMTQHSKDKRAHNRMTSREWLVARKIPFESSNNGAHLIVEGPTGKIDFWPGTGKWIDRSDGKAKRGVRKLVKHILFNA